LAGMILVHAVVAISTKDAVESRAKEGAQARARSERCEVVE